MDPDPFHLLRIRIQGNYTDPADPDPQHCFTVIVLKGIRGGERGGGKVFVLWLLVIVHGDDGHRRGRGLWRKITIMRTNFIDFILEE